MTTGARMPSNGRAAETLKPRGSRFLTPVLAAIGGCVFAAFWITGVFKISVPWMISLPIHAVGMLCLAAGVIVLQKEQTLEAAEPGWVWIPAVGVALSVFFSFEIFLTSVILFALIVLKLRYLPKTGAILLIVGAVTFFLAFFLHGPFWSESNPEPDTPLAIVFATGLVVLAAGWVVLAIGRRSQDPAVGGD